MADSELSGDKVMLGDRSCNTWSVPDRAHAVWTPTQGARLCRSVRLKSLSGLRECHSARGGGNKCPVYSTESG
jgi:hypothetical protein